MTEHRCFSLKLRLLFQIGEVGGGGLKGSSSVSHGVQFVENNEIVMVFSIDCERQGRIVLREQPGLNIYSSLLVLLLLKKSCSEATALAK